MSEFTQTYGEELAPAMLSLWGLSQQRASPSAGMANVLTALDIANGWRSEMDGQAGLAHDRLMKAIRTGSADVGEKLADFADAIRSKQTRQWVGDDPRGGQPAPFNVHATRDVGFVDETTLKHISKYFGPEVAARFEMDAKGAPTDGQYAYGSRFYNQVKDALNANLAPGERPYTADEVQAIGWVGHQNMTGTPPEKPGNIFQSDTGGRSYANISRVAVEAAPGEGAPLRAVWDQIPEERRTEVTYRVLNEGVEDVARTVGVTLRKRMDTEGGWEQWKNPNGVYEVVSTPDGAERFARAMAYVYQQSEVWAHRTATKTKANAFAMDIVAPESFDLSKPGEVARFWKESGLEAVPGLGFSHVQVRDGADRVRIIFERDLGNLSQAAIDDGRDFDILAGAARSALESGPLTGWEIERRPLNLRKAVHDWKGDASGTGHRQGLDRRAGVVEQLDRIAQRAAQSYRREAEAGRAPSRGAGPSQEVAPSSPASGLTLGALMGAP
jgi:hypothetical protein